MINVGAESAVCLVSQVTAADTHAIEEGLHELWRLAGAGEASGAVVRAASMTVVVPIGDEAQADHVTGLLDSLTATHPCRAILLLSDERVAEPRARLASHYRRAADGELPRYWEEVRFVAPPESLHRVMSSVSALRLPNLPVQAWWPGTPAFDDDLFNQVAEVSDRIVVDSSMFTDVSSTLPSLAMAIDAANESVAFADLSWTRLTAWRTLMAEFFDTPSDQALLDSIERVAVDYATDRGGEAAQALLIVGWLGSRLGWEPRKTLEGVRGDWRLQLIDGVRPVQVDIAPSSRPHSGSLQSVSIYAVEGDRQASYSVARGGDGTEAEAIAESDGGRLERHTRLPAESEVELLREELSGFATDRIYQESLNLAVRTLRS